MPIGEYLKTSGLEQLEQRGVNNPFMPRDFEAAVAFSRFIAGSRLAPEGATTATQVFAALVVGAELGLRPVASLAAARFDVTGVLTFEGVEPPIELPPPKKTDPESIQAELRAVEAARLAKIAGRSTTIEIPYDELDAFELERPAHWGFFDTVGRELGHFIHRKLGKHTLVELLDLLGHETWHKTAIRIVGVDEAKRRAIIDELWRFSRPLDTSLGGETHEEAKRLGAHAWDTMKLELAAPGQPHTEAAISTWAGEPANIEAGFDLCAKHLESMSVKSFKTVGEARTALRFNASSKADKVNLRHVAWAYCVLKMRFVRHAAEQSWLQARGFAGPGPLPLDLIGFPVDIESDALQRGGAA